MNARERAEELSRLSDAALCAIEAVGPEVTPVGRSKRWREIIYHDRRTNGEHRFVVVHRDTLVGWHEAAGFAISVSGERRLLELDDLREFL